MDTALHLLTKFQSRITTALTTTATSIVLESVTGIPTAPFMAILEDSTSNAECVLVTTVTTVSKTLTVTRAQRGTTGVAHAAGTLFYHSEIELTDIAFGTSDASAKTVVSGAYGMSQFARVTSGKTEGLMAYFEGHIAGTTTGHTYGLGAWINVDAAAVLTAGHIIVPIEGGVYTSEAQGAARVVFAGQHQAILTGAPTTLHAWRLNATQTITALIAAANPGSVGYSAGTGAGTAVGWIKIADIVGVGVVYAKVYSAT